MVHQVHTLADKSGDGAVRLVRILRAFGLNQNCGTSRIALLVVLLDQLDKDRLQAGPVSLLVALGE